MRWPMVALAVAACAAAGAVGGAWLHERGAAAAPRPAFHLADARGEDVSERSLRGRPSAVFFGYTFCPEVCPNTLTEFTAALRTLGPDAAKVNVVFVSVDPERDTPDRLKLYMSNFDPRIRSLTGSAGDVDAAAKAFGALYMKVEAPGGYLIDHTADIFLLDSSGREVGRLKYGMGPDAVAAAMRQLIATGRYVPPPRDPQP